MQSVTHIITTIERGGAENQLLILVKEQIRSGRAVRVIFLKGNPELEQAFVTAGAVVIGSLKGRNPMIQVSQLVTILENNRRTILHCHLPRAELVTTLANLKIKYPLVISRHNSETFFPGAPNFVARRLSRFVTARANFVVAISKAVHEFLIQNREISPKCPMGVVYYGYPRTDALPHLRQKGAKIIIGTIARLAPQKDIPTLLKAFKNLYDNKHYELVIVGDGVLKEELTRQAESMSLFNVTWRGKVSDVSIELARMDVFVLPSLYEGFGLVLLEAMNAGVPILAARNSAIPEVLGENYPYLFETSNDIELTVLLRKIIDEDRYKLAELGFERLQHFTTTKMLENLDQVYAGLEAKR
jgi:glycosyltransferase involved in cell wall biosynthesis